MTLKTVEDLRARLVLHTKKKSTVSHCAYGSLHRPARNLANAGVFIGAGVACVVALYVVWAAMGYGLPGPGTVTQFVVFFGGGLVGTYLVARRSTEVDCIIGIAGDQFLVLFDPDSKNPRLETNSVSQVAGKGSSFGGLQIAMPGRQITLRFANFPPGNLEQRDTIAKKLERSEVET